MRISPRLMTAAVLSTAAVGALLSAAAPAKAQLSLPDSKPPTLVALRGGVYFPFNASVKNSVGKTLYGGGLDYTLEQQRGLSRTILSLDYIERSSGKYVSRIIPLTVGQFTIQGNGGGVRPYFGVGAGVYFIHQQLPDNTGATQNANKTAFGGYLAAGLDLPSNLLLEARYHYIQKVGDINSSGLQLSAGVRF